MSESTSQSDVDSGKKQPYEAPRVEIEETFEVMSAKCNATIGSCGIGFTPGKST